MALFVALAGTATAATLIQTDDIANSAVTSKKVKNRSLKAIDFKRGTLRRGARGFTGAPGRPGAPGSPGRQGKQGPAGPTVLNTYAAEFDNPDGQQSVEGVACDPGEYATGGGVVTESEDVGVQTVNSSFPTFQTDDSPAPDAWAAAIDNTLADDSDDTNDLTFTVVVTCAPAADVGVFGKRKLLKK
jgi:hypothetical protein